MAVCANCGNNLAADDKFCRVCGQAAAAPPAVSTITVPTTPPGGAQTSGKAVASLICGLLFFIPLAFIAAIVFGHLGLSEIRKSAGRLKGEGMAIAGLVLGYMWIVSIPIILIVAAIAIPNLLRARIAANEASAVSSLRALVTTEITYASQHPSQGFTCSLSDLAQASSNPDSLASGQKYGYVFEISGCAPGPDGGANVKYQVVAYPLRVNQTGVRAFCSDETGVVKVDATGSTRGCLENGTVLE